MLPRDWLLGAGDAGGPSYALLGLVDALDDARPPLHGQFGGLGHICQATAPPDEQHEEGESCCAHRHPSLSERRAHHLGVSFKTC